MEIKKIINLLESLIKNPQKGLPEDIFLFVSRITPIINVDLLIKNEKNQTLLAWRNDIYCSTGWHIPGGVVRFKEKLETRILKVAETEIGAPIKFDPLPVAINQIIREQNIRGHFISILYNCFLSGKFIPKNKNLTSKDPGYLKWHNTCPDNLLKFHEIYRKFL